MSLGFLHPWFWLALGAVTAPLWLHLRRRRETRIVPFAALRFLDDQPVPRRQPLRLRDLLVLVLRVSALTLLVAAFAWPYLYRSGPPVRESLVLVLDNTMSQQAGDRFERARQRVTGALESAAADSEIAVIALEALPRIIAPFGSERAGALQAVRNLAPSFQRGSYLAAFRQAAGLLDRAVGARKRITFVADNQQNQWAEDREAPPFLNDVQIDLPAVDTSAEPNLAVLRPSARRVFNGSRAIVDFAVSVLHSGPARSFRLTVRTDGRVVVDRTVTLATDSEETSLHAEWEADPAEWVRGEVTVEGRPDVLAADDHAFFVLPPVREGSVALLSRSRYLDLALTPEVMRGRWSKRSLSAATLAAEQEAMADVLCLDASALQSSAARNLVRQYLDSGRGVLLLVDRLSPLISASLRELGVIPGDTVAGRPEAFHTIVTSHPLLRPFRSLTLGDFTAVTVSRYVRLRPAAATPLIFAPSGDPLLFERTGGPGRLLVAAFAFDREHSNWPVQSSFIPFLDLALQHLRGGGRPEFFEPAQTAILDVGPRVQEVEVRGSGGWVRKEKPSAGRARLPLPEHPGLYEVRFDGDPSLQDVLAVNAPPLESALRYVDPASTVERWRATSDSADPVRAPVVPAEQAGRANALQQRLWWWLLAGALSLLLAESAWTSLRGARE